MFLVHFNYNCGLELTLSFNRIPTTTDVALCGGEINRPLRFRPFVPHAFSLTIFDLLTEQRANSSGSIISK